MAENPPSKVTHAAGGDQAVRVWSPWSRRIVELNEDRGCGRAASEQARPRCEIGKIKKSIGTTQTDLLGKDRGILCTGAARNDRPGVTKHRGAQLIGKLVEVLVADR
jgi:hypothetical protein